MISYYLKFAIRNLRKNKLFSVINFTGLIIGMTVSFLIFKYVQFETSYDKFHANGEDIYRVRYDSYRNGEIQFKCVGAVPALGPALKADYSEVIEQCRLMPFYDGLTASRDDVAYRLEKVFFADSSFFKMFTHKVVLGDPEMALAKIRSVAISQSTSKKLFGNENPLDKKIKLPIGNDDSYTVVVSAVFEDVPANSHMPIDMLISYNSLASRDRGAETNWGWYDFYTYIQLSPGTNYKQLEATFPNFIKKHTPRDERAYVLQPLYDIHLKSNFLQEIVPNGNRSLTIALGIIAVFILIIAWANYINLSTVIAVERVREIGIRKTNGESKRNILTHFFVESLAFNLICFIVSIGLFNLLMQAFINFAGKDISLVNINSSTWFTLLAVVLAGATISGAFPAFIMSSFNPVKAIRGGYLKDRKTINPRKVFVGFQYVISIVLIICTISIFKQIKYVQNYNLGVNIDRTLVIKGPELLDDNNSYMNMYNTFKTELLKVPVVQSITASSNIPGYEIIWTRGCSSPAMEKYAIMYLQSIDHHYLDAYNIKLAAGRNFIENSQADIKKNILINKTALRLFEFRDTEEALNKPVLIGGRKYTIVGIIEDYHQRGLKENFNPLVIHYSPDNTSFYSIKITGSNYQNLIANIENTYSKVFPANPFEYFFLDSFFNQQYENDLKFSRVVALFSILAIFISCLGLFGLAVFSAKKRTKEVGVRIVNGARQKDVLRLLNSEYIVWIFVAFIVALPIALVFLNRWLDIFAYQTNISWWIFVVAISMAYAIALLTVSFQSLKVAKQNPVEALRYE